MLQRLADMPEVFVSVITGRCLPDIKAKVLNTLFNNVFNSNIDRQVNIKNITYAGNHGLDIVHPDGTKFVPPLPEEVNINLLTIVLVIDVINYVTAGRVKSKLAASETAGRVLSGEKENLVIFELSLAHFQEGAWVENKGIVLAFHHEAWKDKVIHI